jgi:hypothetical protein
VETDFVVMYHIVRHDQAGVVNGLNLLFPNCQRTNKIDPELII